MNNAHILMVAEPSLLICWCQRGVVRTRSVESQSQTSTFVCFTTPLCS